MFYICDFRNKNQCQAIRCESVNIAQNGAHTSLLVFLALSNILEQPIRSIYPEVQYNLRKMFNRTIHSNHTRHKTPLQILWTRYGDLDNRRNALFIPNHFVPVVRRWETNTHFLLIMLIDLRYFIKNIYIYIII